MSIELSSIGDGAFADMPDAEKRIVRDGVRRAEVLEDFHRQALALATYAEGLEAEILVRGIANEKLLEAMRKLVAAADRVRDQLSEGVDDYRSMLRNTPRAMGFVGAFIQQMKFSRTGDADAIDGLQAARDALGLTQATPSFSSDTAADVASSYLRVVDPDQRRAAVLAHPCLEHAFSLEDNIAKMASGRFSPDDHRRFMERIRANIANDLASSRGLPALADIEAATHRK